MGVIHSSLVIFKKNTSQPNLGGNAKTAFIVLISSSIDCVSETISSLRFADTAKQVTVRACVNPMVAPTTLAQQRAFYTKQVCFIHSDKDISLLFNSDQNPF